MIERGEGSGRERGRGIGEGSGKGRRRGIGEGWWVDENGGENESIYRCCLIHVMTVTSTVTVVTTAYNNFSIICSIIWRWCHYLQNVIAITYNITGVIPSRGYRGYQGHYHVTVITKPVKAITLLFAANLFFIIIFYFEFWNIDK